MGDEAGGGEEPRSHSLLTGLGGQSDRQVGFAGADITVEDEVSTRGQELQITELVASEIGGNVMLVKL